MDGHTDGHIPTDRQADSTIPSKKHLFCMGIMMSLVFERIENIVGKGENAGYQHFLYFPRCFQKGFYSGLLKVGTMC